MAKGLKEIKVETVASKNSQVDTGPGADKAAQILGRTKKQRKDPKHYISHHHGHGRLSAKVVVKKGNAIEYIDRATADAQVKNEGWTYGKKSEWKKLVRDIA